MRGVPCRPQRPLRIHRDLPRGVVTCLSWLDREEDEAPAWIRQLIEKGDGDAFGGG
jgi:hypothetical protein